MKECPVCKTSYSDDSLMFCLNDGANLISVSDMPTQRIDFDKMKVEISSPTNFPSDPTVISTPSSSPKKNSNGLIYTLLIVGALLLVGIAAIAAILLYNNKNFTNDNVTATNSATPSPSVSPKSNNDQELNNRIANLEKQLSEQKNAQANLEKTSFPTPTPVSSTPGIVTAKVSWTSDGFLALRSTPNADSGEQILKIPTGATVQIEDCQRNFMTISGKRGRWCMISYEGETGWAFDAWLSY